MVKVCSVTSFILTTNRTTKIYKFINFILISIYKSKTYQNKQLRLRYLCKDVKYIVSQKWISASRPEGYSICLSQNGYFDCMRCYYRIFYMHRQSKTIISLLFKWFISSAMTILMWNTSLGLFLCSYHWSLWRCYWSPNISKLLYCIFFKR